jgi:hypothetical protein
MAAWPKEKDVSLARQHAALLGLFPESSARIQRMELTWVGSLTPSALSRTYRVRLRYKMLGSPEVHVHHPFDPGHRHQKPLAVPQLVSRLFIGSLRPLLIFRFQVRLEYRIRSLLLL